MDCNTEEWLEWFLVIVTILSISIQLVCIILTFFIRPDYTQIKVLKFSEEDEKLEEEIE